MEGKKLPIGSRAVQSAEHIGLRSPSGGSTTLSQSSSGLLQSLPLGQDLPAGSVLASPSSITPPPDPVALFLTEFSQERRGLDNKEAALERQRADLNEQRAALEERGRVEKLALKAEGDRQKAELLQMQQDQHFRQQENNINHLNQNFDRLVNIVQEALAGVRSTAVETANRVIEDTTARGQTQSDILEVGRPGPNGDPIPKQAVETTRFPRSASVSLTQNFGVIVRNRHVSSFGIEAKAAFGEGMPKFGVSVQFDIRGAAQTYSPMMADGRGSSTRAELHLCGVGLQGEHGRVHSTQAGGYTYNRVGLILPRLQGGNESQAISLNRFIPPPIRNFGFTVIDLQLRSGRIIPYIQHVEGQGFTPGLGFGPFEGDLKLFNHWINPTIRVAGQFITGPKADDRTVAPTYKLTSSNKEEMQALRKKLDNVGREVARIANEQRSAFHRNEKDAATKFKKKSFLFKLSCRSLESVIK